MAQQDKIVIRGAREHNLKKYRCGNSPRQTGGPHRAQRFGQELARLRHYLCRRAAPVCREPFLLCPDVFSGQMEKPDVDEIQGLSPAISIDQKTTSKNPRSTVGTVTEIYDYLRLLWARIGIPHCPHCGREIRQQTIDQIVDQVLSWPEGARIQILAPVVRSRKGEHVKVFEDARKAGYVRVRVDGSVYDLSEDIKLDKNKKHNIEVVVDRLVVRPDSARRLTDSAETAAGLSGGLVLVNDVSTGEEQLFLRRITPARTAASP